MYTFILIIFKSIWNCHFFRNKTAKIYSVSDNKTWNGPVTIEAILKDFKNLPLKM